MPLSFTALAHTGRTPIVKTAVLFAAALACTAAGAQAYPAKPVHLVVPNSPGGPADILARLLAERLSKNWQQPVVVENKAGGALMIGTDAVAKAPPDGYTLLLTPDGPITINPALYSKMAYDPQKDLVPVAKVIWGPLILVVPPSMPATSVAELIALAKAEPGKLNYGAGGTTTRIAAELFRLSTDTDMVHIPYKGSGPLVAALLGNQVQLAFDSVTSSLAQVRAGKLRALAITGDARLPSLPDLPTVAEAGVPGYKAGTWIALFAPAATPKDVVDRIHAEVAKVLAEPDVQAKLDNLGMTPAPESNAAFAAEIAADTKKWGDVIRKAGITAD